MPPFSSLLLPPPPCRFLDTNPDLRGATFRSHDAVHTLTCAIMLLNTDLHNEALQQRRMSAEEFVENLAELNDGENFPDPVLRQVCTWLSLQRASAAAVSNEYLEI